MTPMSDRSSARVRLIGLVMAFVLVMSMESAAFAIVDQFGGASYSAPYAPYTAGPVVPEAEAEDTRPYAPYTAGPVVPEQEADTRPYAPYTAGPVVPEVETRPYAPYTAGPVVGTDEAGQNPRIGNYLEY